MDEFDKLVNRFEARRQALERLPGEKPSEKEIVKEIIKEDIDQAMVNMPEPPSSVFNATAPNVTQNVTPTTINQDSEVEQYLEELCDLAMSKNVFTAVVLARKSGNAYLVDALHDKLAGKLYQKLIEQGRIKSIG
jgi:hypothetical protein